MIRTGLHDLLAGAAAITPDAPALTYRREAVGYEAAWTKTLRSRSSVARGIRPPVLAK